MSVFIGYPSFMAYQMMKGKRGNNDGFPSIPGMIARYSALGLTNEQMAANPVWVDKTGNVVDSGGTLEVSSSGGRFDRIAFKNLAIYPRILSKDDCIKAYNYLQTLKAK